MDREKIIEILDEYSDLVSSRDSIVDQIYKCRYNHVNYNLEYVQETNSVILLSSTISLKGTISVDGLDRELDSHIINTDTVDKIKKYLEELKPINSEIKQIELKSKDDYVILRSMNDNTTIIQKDIIVAANVSDSGGYNIYTNAGHVFNVDEESFIKVLYILGSR